MVFVFRAALIEKNNPVSVLIVNADAAFYIRSRTGSCLHFTQFDAITHMFDLKITPSQIKQLAPFIIADQITGFVYFLRIPGI